MLWTRTSSVRQEHCKLLAIYVACLIGYVARLISYVAFLIGYGACLIGYVACLIGYVACLIGYVTCLIGNGIYFICYICITMLFVLYFSVPVSLSGGKANKFGGQNGRTRYRCMYIAFIFFYLFLSLIFQMLQHVIIPSF